MSFSGRSILRNEVHDCGSRIFCRQTEPRTVPLLCGLPGPVRDRGGKPSEQFANYPFSRLAAMMCAVNFPLTPRWHDRNAILTRCSSLCRTVWALLVSVSPMQAFELMHSSEKVIEERFLETKRKDCDSGRQPRCRRHVRAISFRSQLIARLALFTRRYCRFSDCRTSPNKREKYEFRERTDKRSSCYPASHLSVCPFIHSFIRQSVSQFARPSDPRSRRQQHPQQRFSYEARVHGSTRPSDRPKVG